MTEEKLCHSEIIKRSTEYNGQEQEDLEFIPRGPVPHPSLLLFNSVLLCNFIEKSQTKPFSTEKYFAFH